ncbi:GDP-D-glucose phosphorylase 1-like isoform X4 [Dreissena polymorpha]|uniref:GDP-D-glucose phosphorylase 1-like isoform X4 n=1 Tax=Dreissena polymorpha TaxID=45954 RepID=UPI002263CED0|nr:GDP-D-glucose phosphorylase 1-like isoform X4 [Dreissena polymorpha]
MGYVAQVVQTRVIGHISYVAQVVQTHFIGHIGFVAQVVQTHYIGHISYVAQVVQTNVIGHISYVAQVVQTNVIGHIGYVAQLNILRAQERRKPDTITSVNQPFNRDSFNFTKIKPGEILFEMQKLESSKDDCGQMLRDRAVTVEVASKNTEIKVCNQVVINVSPLEYGHVLLLPDVQACNPQILTKYAVELSVDLLLLSKHRGFRVGFNSLCAYASVNHLHVHAYYLDHELFVEHMPVQQLSGVLHEQTLLAAKGFVLQLHGSTPTLLSRNIYEITHYFNNNEIAHNIFMTRGPAFGEPRDSACRTIRVYIWPRKKFIGSMWLKDEAAFNVALAELAGHLPIKVQDLFHGLDEQQIEETVQVAMLEEHEYQKIKENFIDMFSTSPTS